MQLNITSCARNPIPRRLKITAEKKAHKTSRTHVRNLVEWMDQQAVPSESSREERRVPLDRLVLAVLATAVLVIAVAYLITILR